MRLNGDYVKVQNVSNKFGISSLYSEREFSAKCDFILIPGDVDTDNPISGEFSCYGIINTKYKDDDIVIFHTKYAKHTSDSDSEQVLDELDNLNYHDDDVLGILGHVSSGGGTLIGLDCVVQNVHKGTKMMGDKYLFIVTNKNIDNISLNDPKYGLTLEEMKSFSFYKEEPIVEKADVMTTIFNKKIKTLNAMEEKNTNTNNGSDVKMTNTNLGINMNMAELFGGEIGMANGDSYKVGMNGAVAIKVGQKYITAKLTNGAIELTDINNFAFDMGGVFILPKKIDK
ncbi:MAG: hypothetical protein ACRC5M_05195, partial [Anaeroplasmataceae bacterium]